MKRFTKEKTNEKAIQVTMLEIDFKRRTSESYWLHMQQNSDLRKRHRLYGSRDVILLK